MANKKNNIHISVKRLDYAMEFSRYNKTKLMRELENTKDAGARSLRQFQHAVNEENALSLNTLNGICKLMNVSPEYVTGECNIDLSSDHKTNMYSPERIDADGMYIPPFDSTLSDRKEDYETRIDSLINYLQLLGKNGIGKDFIGDDYFFTRDQISSFIHSDELFEWRVQEFLFNQLNASHFFENIGYDMKPKEVNLLTNQKSMVVKVIYDQDDNDTNNPESEE